MKKHIVLDKIFLIDARNPNDTGLIRLQDCLVKIAFSQPSWGTRKPVRWVPLEIQIAEMKKNLRLIVGKDSLREINYLNSDLALSENQFEEFLESQHSAGKIMFYNQPELDQFVVIHPPGLVNVLNSFITDEIFWPKATKFETVKSVFKACSMNQRHYSNKNEISKILEATYKTGQISKKDLQKIWTQKRVPIDTKEISDFVTKLLVHLDVLIIPRQYRDREHTSYRDSSVFFLPCIIKEKLPTSILENSELTKSSISLVFSLKRTTIPAALAYKLIGAVASIWPIKEEGERPLLFQFAAVLNVNSENDMIISIQENEILIYLTNKTSKSRIPPDVAASIQECLVNTLNYALKFYIRSCSGLEKSFNASKLYDMKIGEVCSKRPCVVPITDAMHKSEWICSHGNCHKTSIALIWMFERVS